MHLERKQNIRRMHKEILVSQIIEKQNRTDYLTSVRQKMQQNQRSKNCMLRDMATEMRQKHFFSLASQPMETHKQEWQVESRKQQKLKQL
jgi:hypothetical protein